MKIITFLTTSCLALALASPTYDQQRPLKPLSGPVALPVVVNTASSLPVVSKVESLAGAEGREVESFESDTSSLLSLHRSLVEIPSVSGHEQAVAVFLAQYLQKQHFTVEFQDVGPLPSVSSSFSPWSSSAKPARGNILAYYGSSRPSRVLVTSHMDTVPPYIPYSTRHNGTEIWGRGSVDAKGCLAAQIAAVEALFTADEIQHGDVALLFVVGEEVGGDGMRFASDALADHAWEAAIFGEPTELKLASGHKGNLGFVVSAQGRAGHSGYPELAESANAMLIPALAEMLRLELPASEKYGNSTLNIGRMQGGVAGNVIAEHASASVQVRLAAGTSEEAKHTVQQAVAAIDPRLDVHFVSAGYGPIHIDSDIKGFDTIVVNYGTDIPNLKGQHKRYLYGPGSILVAHADDEHIRTADLATAVDGYKRLIRASLGLPLDGGHA